MGAHKPLVGFALEHPDVMEAIDAIAAEYEGEVALHLVVPATAQNGLEVNDVVIRTTEYHPRAVAIIKPDGEVIRLDES